MLSALLVLGVLDMFFLLSISLRVLSGMKMNQIECKEVLEQTVNYCHLGAYIAGMHACIHTSYTYIRTYIYTYIHTYIHIYTHIHTPMQI